ncbi:hypothetical protein PGH07_01155 [Sulfurovum sp. zt1-1]|uniref:Uncharacterized protein n=1 Tax=Sulfurovum zhangzhouensis TaxID=3019067 RepID=A0ABT7QVA8_9BACT|nr:hypothetical protein [Sulfurovum zhangzhouensis]MDM5270779.1 hypothetical protein [Sulfurovum zhangzhouensis]
MRGSVYYQTGQLTKAIFVEGAKKEDRINPEHPHYKCIASYKSMKTYRDVWNNLGNYLKEHWKIKDFEKITAEHIDAYISYKIEYYPSRQYLEKVVSALGKLEDTLKRFALHTYGQERDYDFSIRQNKLHYAKVQQLVADGYHNRVYLDSKLIIDNLSSPKHKIAALIQLSGGARSEGVSLIKKDQLKDITIDPISKEELGIIETKEKGGKIGDVMVETYIYKYLQDIIETEGVFRIKYQEYADDIRQTCLKIGIIPHGSHGFRWTFAQNRVRIYQDHGYTYEQALQGVSWEMKHFRPDITEHYLGG